MYSLNISFAPEWELLSSGADIEKFGRSSGAEWLTLHAGADTVRTGAGMEINVLSFDGVK